MSLIMISLAGFLRIVAQEHTQQTQKAYQRTHIDVLECPDWIFWPLMIFFSVGKRGLFIDSQKRRSWCPTEQPLCTICELVYIKCRIYYFILHNHFWSEHICMHHMIFEHPLLSWQKNTMDKKTCITTIKKHVSWLFSGSFMVSLFTG